MSAEHKRFDKKWKGRAYPEVIAEDVAKLKAHIAALETELTVTEDIIERSHAELVGKNARIAALEKCIEARDAYIGFLDKFVPSNNRQLEYRDAIRRADEEAGRS